MSVELDEAFWTDRYVDSQTGWDIGFASTPLVTYIDQLKNKNIRILIPGAGNAYEAEYLFKNGFEEVYVLDISKKPLENLQLRIPNFPSEHLIHQNFFDHDGQYDLILEQTFFCALHPSLRTAYSDKMYELLNINGKLIGVWFSFKDRDNSQGPPFNGSLSEYLTYFKKLSIQVFEDCYNSIEPRNGNELFAIMQKTH